MHSSYVILVILIFGGLAIIFWPVFLRCLHRSVIMDQKMKATIVEAFNYAIAAVGGQLARAKVDAVKVALEAEKLRFENARADFMKLETLKK